MPHKNPPSPLSTKLTKGPQDILAAYGPNDTCRLAMHLSFVCSLVRLAFFPSHDFLILISCCCLDATPLKRQSSLPTSLPVLFLFWLRKEGFPLVQLQKNYPFPFVLQKKLSFFSPKRSLFFIHGPWVCFLYGRPSSCCPQKPRPSPLLCFAGKGVGNHP